VPNAGAAAARRPLRVLKRDLPAHAALVWQRLGEAHPDAHCELAFHGAFQLLCATILSAQCTDKRVNMVTPALFAAYPDARALAAARAEDVEELVRTTGFFRSKAKNLVGMARALVERHGGEVPADVGVTVDTHVARVSRRLGLTASDDPVRIERDLMPLFPQPGWALLSHRLIFHGRRVCEARRPRCAACVLAGACPSAFAAGDAPAGAAAAPS
jgi:endonuclease-3